MMFVEEWKSFDGMCCRMFNSRACYMAGAFGCLCTRLRFTECLDFHEWV